METALSIREVASKVRHHLKLSGYTVYKNQVRVCGELIVIDNVPLFSASEICSAATGLKFIHVTESITKLSR